MNATKIIITGIACSLILSLPSCKKKVRSEQLAVPVPVVAYTVQYRKVAFYDSYPGTVIALNEVELHSQVSGYITGIFFNDGSRVVKGQKLYEIDSRKYQAVFDQAKDNAEIADANLQKAQRDAERYTRLNEQNAIAKQTFDDAMTNLQNSKMQLLSAKAALLNAETDFNYSVITAPFSGIIGFSLVKPGTYVNSGQTLLNTISSDDPIGVDFIVNEKSLPDFLNVQKNETIKIDSTFSIVLPDNSEYEYFGKLSVIDRAVDTQTGTIKIRLVFTNPEGRLRPGLNCKVKVLSGNSGNQLVIPFKSVVEQMGEYFVYLIDNKNVKQTKVDLGSNLGEYIVVMKGVKPGDNIVLDGIQKVHDGSLIQVMSPSGKKDVVSK